MIFAFGIHLIIKRLRRRRVLIIMYHGLIDRDNSDEWTQLPVTMFEKQMEYISRILNPVSLDDAIGCLGGENSIPPDPVVITFDDGYESNFTTGLEILKKYNIPAIVFITSSFIGDDQNDGKPLWFDSVNEIVAGWPSDKLDLSLFGLEEYDLQTPINRTNAADRITDSMKKWSGERKIKLLSDLSSSFPGESKQYHRGASWKQIKEAFPLITSGAHTVNHEILSGLSSDAAQKEIVGSKREIEGHTGKPVKYFAYPNGGREDFTSETVKLVAESGFEAAVTTIEGFNDADDNLLELKRIGVGSDTDMLWFKMAVTGTIDFLKGRGF